MPCIVTYTFAECGENHVGMEQIGERAEEGGGFNLRDLLTAGISAVENHGCTTRLVDLREALVGVDLPRL